MILVIGLGNPGKKYDLTRHNIGERTVKEFATHFNFPIFKLNNRVKSRLSKEIIGEREVVLALPTTYMNESGLAVQKLVTSFKLQVTSLWIVHDDIDLPLGKIRISQNRSSAGHRGVESVIKHLATQNFVRFRLGIKTTATEKMPSEKFVLQKFSRNEQKTVQGVIKLTTEAIKFTLENGLDKTMEHYN